MNTAALFPFLIGLLTSAIVCGAWWYAALRKRSVAIYYWLAAGHTLSFVLHAFTIGIYAMHIDLIRVTAISGLQTLMSVVMAGLYVALVLRLVEEP